MARICYIANLWDEEGERLLLQGWLLARFSDSYALHGRT